MSKMGFYIDVGAHLPRADSVTLAFYERGWSGINVEPAQAPFDALVAGRPRDRNLRLCCGECPGVAPFYVIPDTGLSTLEIGLVESHARIGFAHAIDEIEIVPLAEICRRHVSGAIHFLKVDCEGAERAVLAGADFTAYRPWIVLVEATVPMTQDPSFDDWEPLLVEAGYGFVWFDGLNRFYLANEHAEALGAAFKAPPNVFDNWVKAPLPGADLEPETLIRALYRVLRGRSPGRRQLVTALETFKAGDLEALVRDAQSKQKRTHEKAGAAAPITRRRQ